MFRCARHQILERDPVTVKDVVASFSTFKISGPTAGFYNLIVARRRIKTPATCTLTGVVE
jgi:hypothetical protein